MGYLTRQQDDDILARSAANVDIPVPRHQVSLTSFIRMEFNSSLSYMADFEENCKCPTVKQRTFLTHLKDHCTLRLSLTLKDEMNIF